MRALIIVLVLAAAPALAEPFPTPADAWHYEGRAPAGVGMARFARLDATPDGRGGWRVAVVCGRVSLRTGHEAVEYRGGGSASRARGGWLGGTLTASGFPTLGWSIEHGLLDQRVLFAAPGEDKICPNGRGDFSSGD